MLAGGNALYTISVVDAYGLKWMILEWEDNTTTGRSRPKLSLLLSLLQHQDRGLDGVKYTVNTPIPPTVLDGSFTGVKMITNPPTVGLLSDLSEIHFCTFAGPEGIYVVCFDLGIDFDTTNTQ